MNHYVTMKYEIIDQIAVITLNRPDRYNSFNQALRLELHQALNEADQDPSVQALVITGAGTALCCGADLQEVSNPEPGEIERQLLEEYRPLFSTLYRMNKPVICAVNGIVAGAGCTFPLLADYSVWAENSYLYPAFTGIGLVPDCGISLLLQKRLGTRRSYLLLLENEKLSASRCLELGLADKVVDADSVLPEALAWAKKVSRSNLSVPSVLKALLRDVSAMDYEDVITHEAPIQEKLVQTPESKALVNAFVGNASAS